MPEADGSSHAELMAGAETLEKLQVLPVRGAVLLTTGRENCRGFRVPSTDGFWKFSDMVREEEISTADMSDEDTVLEDG